VSSPSYRTPADAEPTAELPVDVEARLGALRSTHAPAPPVRSPLLLPAVIALVMLPVSYLLGRGAPGSSLWGLLALPVVLGLMVWTLRGPKRTVRVALHRGGVAVEDRGAREVVLFDDVDEVWIEQRWVRTWEVAFATITAVRLVLRDGRSCRVPTEVEDNLAVFRWVLRHCSDPLLPEARAALGAGETLRFGSVEIDGEGITVRGARARWKEIRLARADLGALSLFRRMRVFPWRTVQMDAIPHPTVFARLAAERLPRVERDYPAEWEVD
jgi:hypothetical protein